MGVYDLSRLSGEDHSQLAVFERQNVLHTLFTRGPQLDVVVRHWVGLEYSLLQHLQEASNLCQIPFKTSHMLRLCSSNDAAAQYELVMRPISIPQYPPPAGAPFGA